MSKKEKIIIVWYKRDLRVEDHRPLFEALMRGNKQNIPVLALYSFEPNIVNAPDFSSFHRQFLIDCLNDLTVALKKINVEICIFEKHISDVLKYVQEHYHITEVFSHEETGNALTYERDILMAEYLRYHHIIWSESPSNGVVRRLKSRDKWLHIWHTRMQAPLIPIPQKQGERTYLISSHFSGGFERNNRLQKGGEIEAKKTFSSFLQSRGMHYMGGMSRPMNGQNASSRISVYLAYGCISLRYAFERTNKGIEDAKKSGNTKLARSLQAFRSRLYWHSHFIQKLESEPSLEHTNALSIYNTVRRDYNDILMDAIESARTGIPFIDAVILQLQSIGWVNFRSRATLVSFVCCTCMQPWNGRFAHWLARVFTDYEPGIHYPQLQMQSGTMGINTIRIYNPVKQLKDKDSDGQFIATWLPELKRLPKYLQAEPWKISPMESIEYDFVLGRDYPFPIVDVEEANRRARSILYELKKQGDGEEKLAIVERHGSRQHASKKRVKKDKNPSSSSVAVSPANNLSLF